MLQTTPQALANFSPRLERSDNFGLAFQINYNPERVSQLANPFQGSIEFFRLPQGSRSSNPGLKLANAFGVYAD